MLCNNNKCQEFLPKFFWNGQASDSFTVVGAPNAGKSHFFAVMVERLLYGNVPNRYGFKIDFDHDNEKERYKHNYWNVLYKEPVNLLPETIPHSARHPYHITLTDKINEKNTTLTYYDFAGLDPTDERILARHNQYFDSKGIFIILDNIFEISYKQRTEILDIVGEISKISNDKEPVIAVILAKSDEYRNELGSAQGAVADKLDKIESFVKHYIKNIDKKIDKSFLHDDYIRYTIIKDLLQRILRPENTVEDVHDDSSIKREIEKWIDIQKNIFVGERLIEDFITSDKTGEEFITRLNDDLKTFSHNIAFFCVSSLGVSFDSKSGKLTDKPKPEDIEYPFIWMAEKLGFIKRDVWRLCEEIYINFKEDLV